MHLTYVASNKTKRVHDFTMHRERAPRRQQFHLAPRPHIATKERCKYPVPLRWIFKTALRKATISHSFTYD